MSPYVIIFPVIFIIWIVAMIFLWTGMVGYLRKGQNPGAATYGLLIITTNAVFIGVIRSFWLYVL